MSTARQTAPVDLERREFQSTIFACAAIAIMGIGSAVLMYPVVFNHQGPPDRSLRVAFFGFCGLCVLLASALAGWLWDRFGASTTFLAGAALVSVPLLLCWYAPRHAAPRR